MKRFVFAAVSVAVALSAGSAFAQTRVDVNGELVTTGFTNSGGAAAVSTTMLPDNWEAYGDAGQVNASGEVAVQYTPGSGSGGAVKWAVAYESPNVNDGSKYVSGGQSVIFGGASAAGTYGIKQTITSTAGKLYMMIGQQNMNISSASLFADWGIGNGTTTAVGAIGNGNFSQGSSPGKMNGNSAFFSSVVATGDQVTSHVGIKAVNPAGINAYVDGIRVLEFDIPTYTSLFNGGFDADQVNLTNYNKYINEHMGTTPTGDFLWHTSQWSALQDQFYQPGWLMTGNALGQILQVAKSNQGVGHETAMMIDFYKGLGREYAFQKVKMGGAGTSYSLSGMLKATNAAAIANGNGKIGIDPFGGTDATSSNIIWCDALTAADAGLWVNRSLNNIIAQGDGTVTIFLAAGVDQLVRQGDTAQTFFDSINLTAVPEPGSFLALGTGLIGLLGIVRRKK